MTRKRKRFFTIRQVFCRWYVYEWEQGRIVERHGPYTYAEAEAKADETGATDYDRYLHEMALREEKAAA